MAKQLDIVSFKKYQKKDSWNVGLVLFGAVLLYLAVTILLYLSRDRVAGYEVREGSILKDTAFTGIVLRQESVVSADQGGFVNYFPEEGQKISVGSNIYTLTPEALEETENPEANAEVALSEDDWESIVMNAQSFHESFRPSEFQTAIDLRRNTETILQSKTSQNRVTQLNTLLQEGSVPGMILYQAGDDGIVVYSVDGYEGLALGDVTEELLSMSNYTKTVLSNNREVAAGDPVYKLVTSEEWTLVIKLSEEMETLFRDKMDGDSSTTVRVRFLKDNESMIGTLQIYNREESDAYGYLTFTSGMIRYAQDRFLDIELILEDESGLKIPKSAVISKDFYVVPEDFLSTGGASKETGVLKKSEKKDGEASAQFVPATVFYRDDETGLVYLDKDAFQEGDVLLRQESTETVRIGRTEALEGVYNINRGYAVFRPVHVLCESEDYYIVEEGNSYGLSNYDHIALDGSSVQEDEVINQ